MVNSNIPVTRFRSAAKLGWAASAFVAACLIGQGSAQAATAPATAPLVSAYGSVDIQKVLTAYNKRTSANDDLKAQADQYLAAFNIQKADNMLSETDQNSLSALLLKPTRTPADEAQITALQTRSQADASELTALQQKPNLTPADTARLAALTKEQQAGTQALTDANTNYSQMIDQKNQQESDALLVQIKAAVASVAQSKGLAIVFDSSVAIYAGNDVTQLVIDRLNAAK